MRALPVEHLPTCCGELEINALSLLFPERFSPEGLEFVNAHGLEAMTVAELRANTRYIAKGVIKIKHRCQHAQPDGRCGIYAMRPKVCRDFDCKTRHDCACQGSGRAFED